MREPIHRNFPLTVKSFQKVGLLYRTAQSSGTTLANRYMYRVLQRIQKQLIRLCVWAEAAILSSTKTALKFKYEI